jgi:hypothetical protein
MSLDDFYSTSSECPFDTVGLFTFTRTYARRLNESDVNSNVESWKQAIIRVVESCNSQLGCSFSDNEKKEFFSLLYNLKCSVAGRFLWQLGTKAVDRVGLNSLQNCCAIAIDEPITPFTWSFDFLMNGSGVGVSVERKYLEKLPVIKGACIVRKDTKDADFIVPDTREGWTKLLGKVLKSHFYSGKGFTYSCQLIRSKGAPIKGFGGISSGPEDLCEGLKEVSNILNKRIGLKLRSIDALDIINIIGKIVISGNVRRCFPKGTLIHTKEGLIRIEDVKVGTSVLTSKGYFPVSENIQQGKQPLISVKTQMGTYMMTKNHRLAVMTGMNNYIWKEAQYLSSNDKLVFIHNLDISDYQGKFSILLTENVAWHIGFFSNDSKFDQRPDALLRRWKFSALYVPDYIMSANLNIMKAYLAGVYDSTNLEEHVVVKSNFTTYLYQVQSLCAYLGIITFIEDNKLICNSKFSIDALIFNIRFMSMRCNNINSYAAYKASEITYSKEWLNKDYDFTLDDYVYYMENKYPSMIPIQVVEIEESSVDEETYDLSVFDNHEFVFGPGLLSHNSAIIVISDPDDLDFIQAKRWDLGSIPNWRCYSNNSLVCSDIKDLHPEFWKPFEIGGECYGLINTDLAKKCGRLGETQYPDPDIIGTNPCFSGDTRILILENNEPKIVPFTDLIKRYSTEVQVYSINLKTSNIEIQTGFYPRKTQHQVQLYRVVFDDNTFVDVTEDHVFYLSNGYHTLTTELKDGDKVPSFNINQKIEVDIGIRSNNCDHCNLPFQRTLQKISFCSMDCYIEHNLFNEPLEGESRIIKYIYKLPGLHDTYNITVQKTHTIAVVTSNNEDLTGVFIPNCGEQPLCSGETCCLAELFLPNIETYDQLIKCVTYLYRTCKHSLRLKCSWKNTESIVHKNMRMGIGVTGYLQASEEQKDWLSKCYVYLRQFDKEYSKIHNLPMSIKLTTCKPSGCSRKDSLILTNTGLLRLDEIGFIDAKDKWQPILNKFVFNNNGLLRKVTKFFINGNVPTRKIYLVSNLELESSMDHSYQVVDSNDLIVWKKVEDIEIGDKLIYRVNDYPENKHSITDVDLCSVITYFILHGLWYEENKIITVYDKESMYIDTVIKNLQSKFNIPDNKVTFSLKNERYSIVKIYSPLLTLWFKDICLTSRYSDDDESLNISNIELPKYIRTASRAGVIAFFEPLRNKYVYFTLAFAQQLLVLSRSVGIQSEITDVHTNNDDEFCYLFVSDKTFPSLVYYDVVKSITESHCDTYDIQVEIDHNYQLCSFVSHNTLSLLAGCTSGIHPGYSQYYIRRIRFNSNHGLVKVAKAHGYRVEYVRNFDGTTDYSTSIVEFPYALPIGTQLAENTTAVQQLEYIKKVQTEWSDNSVSCCLTKGHKINTSKGFIDVSKFTNLKSKGFQDHKIDVYNRYGKLDTSNMSYYNGDDITLKVYISNGFDVIGTRNHKLMKVNKQTKVLEWVKIKDLKKNDILACRKGLNLWPCSNEQVYDILKGWHWDEQIKTVPTTFKNTKDLFRWLSMLIKYCLYANDRLEISTSINFSEFEQITISLFNREDLIKSSKETDNYIYYLMYGETRFIDNREIIEWLKYLEVFDEEYKLVHLPSILFCTMKEYVQVFFEELMLKLEDDYFYLYTSSQSICQDLATLGSNLGYYCSSTLISDLSDYLFTMEANHSMVYDLGFQEKFFKEHVPLLKSWTFKNKYKLEDTLQISEELIKQWRDLGATLDIPSFFEDPTYYFVHIIDIEEYGVQETFDISVADTNSYLINAGIISHNTVTFKKEEIPEIKDWLTSNFSTSLKSVSFLLHSGHGFIQAPIEPISKEEYEKRIKECRKVSDLTVMFTEDEQKIDEAHQMLNECVGGVCPIK